MDTQQTDSRHDLLEEAHLAFARGHLAEARLMLETVVDAQPDNSEAAALLAQVVARQASASSSGQQGSFWSRDFIPRRAARSCILGLILLVGGAINAAPALQAGWSHGFGPLTTVDVPGRLSVHAVPIRAILVESCIMGMAGIASLLYAYWDAFRRGNGDGT